MKKKAIKIIVVAFVFIAAVIFFELRMSQVNEDLTSKMDDAVLPTVSFTIDGAQYCQLHGYTEEMNAASVRDDIIAIGEDGAYTIRVETYGTAVTGIECRIRSIDGSRLLAEENITGYHTSEDTITADETLPTIIESDTEYVLDVTLKMEDRTTDYYCRLIRTERCQVQECAEFAEEFHEKTFTEGGEEFLSPYMETSTGSNTTLQYVDLTCSVDQVMWGEFQGDIVGTPVISFKEINTSYNALTITYSMSSLNDEGETEYYNIEEYYRLRQSGDRMYVLNFERTMDQIFRSENNFLTSSDNILLGIRDKDVECQSSENGRIIYWVQAGDFWSYDITQNTLTSIFTFRSAEGIDARENYGEHDIRIINAEDDGSAEFIVYGYMNRGSHEGECGMILYHYNPTSYTLEEKAFLPSDASYEILKAEMEQLMYESQDGILYLMMMGNLYAIDLNTLETSVKVADLESGCYTISYDKRYIAWIPSDQAYSSPIIHLEDLSTGKSYEIDGEGMDYVRPITFMDGDFIYGAANASDIYVDATGMTVFPLSALRITEITDDGLNRIKSYEPSGGLIGSVTIDSFTIHIDLIKGQTGSYVVAGTDSIVNREADESTGVAIETISSGSKEKVVQLETGKTPGTSKMKRLSSDEIHSREVPLVTLPDTLSTNRYYIYKKGDVLLATNDISEAILLADDNMGVVVDDSQNYIWKRAKKNYVDPFQDIHPNEADEGKDSLTECLSAIVRREGGYTAIGSRISSGETSEEILSDILTGKSVMSLQNLTAEQVLYFISSGNPVLAMTAEEEAILLIGYTASEIYYYDPDEDEVHSISYAAMNEKLENGGQRYLIYR